MAPRRQGPHATLHSVPGSSLANFRGSPLIVYQPRSHERPSQNPRFVTPTAASRLRSMAFQGRTRRHENTGPWCLKRGGHGGEDSPWRQAACGKTSLVLHFKRSNAGLGHEGRLRMVVPTFSNYIFGSRGPPFLNSKSRRNHYHVIVSYTSQEKMILFFQKKNYEKMFPVQFCNSVRCKITVQLSSPVPHTGKSILFC